MARNEARPAGCKRRQREIGASTKSTFPSRRLRRRSSLENRSVTTLLREVRPSSRDGKAVGLGQSLRILCGFIEASRPELLDQHPSRDSIVTYVCPDLFLWGNARLVMATVLSAQPENLVHTAPSVPTCRVETLPGGRPQSTDAWLQLLERTTGSHVHHHPDYVAAALPDLDADAWTITCEAEGQPSTMAILIPKRLTFGRQLLPGAAASLVGTRLAGFGLLGSQNEGNVAAIVQRLAAELPARSIPVVEFEEMDERSVLWQQLRRLQRRGFRFVPASDFAPHRRIRLPQTADEYWSSFKSKTRYTLRKKRKRLGAYTVRRYTDADQVAGLLEAAHSVSLRTWQTHQLGLRVKADEANARYFRFLAEQGALRSYVLVREQEPVAFVLSHQWNGVYHYDELGFDRRLVDLAPGNVLLQEIIDDLLAHDRPDVLDFGLGDAEYKRLFANEETRTATVRMFSPGLRGFWQTASLRLRKKFVRSARSVASRIGFAARLRRALRDRAAN